jgi:hypothetical protein
VASMAADLPVGRKARPLGPLVAYAAPAAAAWALVGLLGNLAPVRLAALGLTVAYGAYYGLIEVAGRPGLPTPGRFWQVPSQWVDNVPRWRRILTWGALLGPGFATRNPYAGFGLLVLVVCSVGNIRLGVALAAALGLLHGLARALALLRDTRRVAVTDYLDLVARSMRWRTIDGLTLLAVAGAATITIVIHG